MNTMDDLFHLYGDDHDLHLDEWIDFDHLAIEMESKTELSIVHHHREEQGLQHRNDRSLDEAIASLLYQPRTTSISMEGLREIATLIERIRLTKLSISEWQTYLASGTGQIKVSLTQTSNLSIWPEEVKKTMIDENEIEIDNDIYVTFTKNYLERLHQKLKQLEIEKNQCQERWNGYTSQINQKLEQVVFEHSIEQADLCLQHKLINMEHQHRNRLLEVEFEELQPSIDQLQIYRKSYELNCDYERTKINIDLLKQYVFYKKFPSSFNQHYRLPIPHELQSIEDLSIRSTLSNRYQQIVQQTKSDFIVIHLSIAETKLRQSQELLHQYQQQLDEQQLTLNMTNLLKRRCQDYQEHLQRLYQFKMNFFVKAPTVIPTH